MLDVVFSTRFKKDLKLIKKRGYDLELLDEIVIKLQDRESLDKNNSDHDLTGNYMGFRECHILPDWLLIYRIDEDDSILFLSRTGTHSDLF